jgi:hypothetical protein
MDLFITIFIVLFVVLIVGLPIATSLREKRKSAAEIDLRSVCDAMAEKHQWTSERAYLAQMEYIRFLTLLQKKPGFMLVPWLDPQGRDDLDQFWHQHILDTAKYAADCNALFGRMIHHNPHVVKGSGQEQESVDKTRRLYARTFSSGYYGSEAPAVDFSGCSACGSGSDSSDSHSHSSHSSHGSDGGHSGDSGSHSCGGHGCGSSCGSSCGGH